MTGTVTTPTAPIDPATLLPRWQPGTHVGARRIVVLPPMLLNILDSLCEGKSNREIAADWGISEDTVKTHIKRLFVKLGAKDRTHAVSLVFSGAADVRIKPARGSRDWSTTSSVADYL